MFKVKFIIFVMKQKVVSKQVFMGFEYFMMFGICLCLFIYISYFVSIISNKRVSLRLYMLKELTKSILGWKPS